MSTINSFYRDPNAVAYASQLFSGSSPAKPTATTNTGHSQSDRGTVSDSAGQRALARIIEILSLGDGGSADQADVSESLGYITSVTGTDGNDSLTFTGRGVYQVETGNGDDSLVAKSAAMAGIALDDGKDSLKASATLLSEIDGGAGDDDIQLTGSLIMTVTGGDGNDTIKASGDTLANIDGGAGDDTMYLEGSRIFASGGTGNDTVTIHQTPGSNSVAEYAFAAGDGQDTITTDGPLALQLGGFQQGDITVTASTHSLILTFAGSSDKMTVTFDGAAAKGSTPSFAFANQDGHLTLQIKSA
ncbi:RTX toxin [Agrobacterium vitis]|uniref:RTX toxin n=1 Tax=Agrobacterium vitis TaxID=373 RepID=UPI0012E91BA7|nr:RTX toxin [Agrobacterium vitis]MVA70670.1 RTX toxin [Agrobacterium vitis]